MQRFSEAIRIEAPVDMAMLCSEASFLTTPAGKMEWNDVHQRLMSEFDKNINSMVESCINELELNLQ